MFHLRAMRWSVSHSREYLWILSRTPTMDTAVYDDIVSRLLGLGFDPQRLHMTPQSPGVLIRRGTCRIPKPASGGRRA